MLFFWLVILQSEITWSSITIGTKHVLALDQIKIDIGMFKVDELILTRL